MSTHVFHLHSHVQTRLSSTVIKCLDQLFTLCGTPSYIHSDRGTSFLSHEIKTLSYTKRNRYQQNNTIPPKSEMGQCERYKRYHLERSSTCTKIHTTYRFPIGKWYFQVCYTRSDHSCQPQLTLHPMRGYLHFNVVLWVVCH